MHSPEYKKSRAISGNDNIGTRVKLRHQAARKIPLNRCTVCVKILTCLRQPRDPKWPKLGSWKEVILSTRCEAHRKFILQCLRVSISNTSFTSLSIISNSRGVRIVPSFHSNELYLTGRQSVSVDLAGAKKLRAHWIDHNLFKRWKQHCDRFHGADCHRFPGTVRLASHCPAFLVDTWRNCIVRGDSSMTYVALSYVWGSVRSLRTQRDNVSWLQQPGALAGNTDIATTVLHAIKVVQYLKERYLWVDQLCIIQDDEVLRHSEIQNMSIIYANASITIIAASNASYGIAGLQGTFQPRQSPQLIHKFRNTEIAESTRWPTFDNCGMEPSLWSTRGWTFQEELFSHRQLIFSRESVRWECKTAIWHEDLPRVDQGYMPTRSLDGISKILSMFSHQFPDITELVQLIRNYAQRNLTYQEDTLFACSGMLNALSSSYSGGFISGLPRAFFGTALLWLFNGPAERRKATVDTNDRVCLPSWSWAGWKGEFYAWNWHREMDFLKRTPRFGRLNLRCSPYVKSSVQWHGLMTRCSRGEVICCVWKAHRQRYYDTDRAMPPTGWTRYRTSFAELDDSRDSLPSAPEATPKFIYKHESCEKSEFWYPVPLSQKARVTDNLVPFISCKTQRTYLLGGPQLTRVRHDFIFSVSTFSLLDPCDKCIGALNPNETLPKNDTDEQLDHGLVGTQLELVKIAQGCHPKKGSISSCPDLPELSCDFEPGIGEFYEFYSVLWIEWKDGVAYRKGLGRVIKDAWNSQDLDEIDLLLG